MTARDRQATHQQPGRRERRIAASKIAEQYAVPFGVALRAVEAVVRGEAAPSFAREVARLLSGATPLQTDCGVIAAPKSVSKARELLAKVQPFDEWVQQYAPSDEQKRDYVRVVEGLQHVASGDYFKLPPAASIDCGDDDDD